MEDTTGTEVLECLQRGLLMRSTIHGIIGGHLPMTSLSYVLTSFLRNHRTCSEQSLDAQSVNHGAPLGGLF